MDGKVSRSGSQRVHLGQVWQLVDSASQMSNARLRSVHNIRIERLWVDVTAKVGARWASTFRYLEQHMGLDINSANHIWLLHHLSYVPTITKQPLLYRCPSLAKRIGRNEESYICVSASCRLRRGIQRRLSPRFWPYQRSYWKLTQIDSH